MSSINTCLLLLSSSSTAAGAVENSGNVTGAASLILRSAEARTLFDGGKGFGAEDPLLVVFFTGPPWVADVVGAFIERLNVVASVDDSEKRWLLICLVPDSVAVDVEADTLSLRLADEADCGRLVATVGPLADARDLDVLGRGADMGLVCGVLAVVTVVEWTVDKSI